MTLDDVADRAAAAADLDGQARGRVDMEQEFGEADAVLVIAVLETRKPLPADILKDIRAGADDWFTPNLRPSILDAIAAQERQHAA